VSEQSEAIVFAGSVDDHGHVRPDQVNATRGRLAKWKGKRVTVVVRRYVKPKTNQQLALYFAAVMPAWAEWCGYDPDEMHRELKRAFLAPQLVLARLTGEERMELPSLADLNAEEMSTYLERVLREGRQRGIEFPMDAVA